MTLAVGVVVLWTVLVPRAIEDAPVRTGLSPAWDLHSFFLPKFVFGTEELLHGVLPIWNRFEFAGIPFLASAQPAALYVPKILAFALLDPESALRLFLGVHYLLLVVLFLLFLRDQRIGPLGCLAGGAFWTFNIPILLSNYHPVRISNLAWMPLIFLIGDRLGRSPRASTFAALSLLIAAQLTAGYPEFTVDCAILLGLHAVVAHAVGQWARPPWKTVPLLGMAFLFGGAAAALQVLPLGELLFVSERAEFAAASTPRFRVVALSPVLWLQVVGLPGLLALATAVRGQRAVVALAGLAACALVYLIAWRLIRLVPGFSGVRHPLAWLLLSQFFLAWLVACGADGFVRPPPPGGAASGRRALVGLLGLAWAALCVTGAFAPVDWWPRLTVLLGSGARGPGLATGLGVIGGLLLGAAARTRGRESHGLAAVAIVLLLGEHLSAFPFGAPLAPLRAPDPAERLGHIVSRQEPGTGRALSLSEVRVGVPLLDHVEDVFGMEWSFPSPRFAQLAQRLDVDFLRNRMSWSKLASSPGVLGTLDVRFIEAPRGSARLFRLAGFEEVGAGEKSAVILRRQGSLGRAWGVYSALIAESPELALAFLFAPGFDPRLQVILERPPRRPYEESRAATPASVRYVTPTRTEVEVEMEAPGVLVLADSCYPGWEAFVDGEKAEILCANYLVRGVELDAGRHVVRFEYRPWSVRWGAVVSALTTFGLVALLLGSMWRKRRRPARGTA